MSSSPSKPTNRLLIPPIRCRACNFGYIVIQWDEPTAYGDALIVGYKVFVNGVVEAVLGPQQRNFSLTTGKWCREYIFQVQALTSCDGLHSKPSDPLVATWPGVHTPVLDSTPVIDGDRVTVRWEKPEATEGVRIKLYKVAHMPQYCVSRTSAMFDAGVVSAGLCQRANGAGGSGGGAHPPGRHRGAAARSQARNVHGLPGSACQ